MRFLLDANLSPAIALHVGEAGHEATHVRDVGLSTSTDEVIMDFAAHEDFVLISQDSDFTNLLFYRKSASPSVILLRSVQEVSAIEIATLILDNLEQVHEPLEDGAIVSMFRDRVRVRRFPIV